LINSKYKTAGSKNYLLFYFLVETSKKENIRLNGRVPLALPFPWK
jgi:hypothetical protein